MNKNVLVISTSLRTGSNSDQLADEFIKGAQEGGNMVEKVMLRDTSMSFCTGCLACQKSKNGHCVNRDDADRIVEKMVKADVIVFATPIYFYEMSGQMKTLLDRTNPIFPITYEYRDIYLLATAAEADTSALDGAIKGLTGWIECFEQANLKGVLYGVGVDEQNAIRNHLEHLDTAFQMGKAI